MVPPPCAPLPGEGRTRGPDGRRSSSLLPSVGWPVHPDLLPSCGAFRACVSPLKSVCSMNSKIVRTAATQAWTTPMAPAGPHGPPLVTERPVVASGRRPSRAGGLLQALAVPVDALKEDVDDVDRSTPAVPRATATYVVEPLFISPLCLPFTLKSLVLLCQVGTDGRHSMPSDPYEGEVSQ